MSTDNKDLNETGDVIWGSNTPWGWIPNTTQAWYDGTNLSAVIGRQKHEKQKFKVITESFQTRQIPGWRRQSGYKVLPLTKKLSAPDQREGGGDMSAFFKEWHWCQGLEMPITSYLLSKNDVSVLGVLYRTLETTLGSTADPSRTADSSYTLIHWPSKAHEASPPLFFWNRSPYLAQDSQSLPPAPRCYNYKWEQMDNVCLLDLPTFLGDV